MEELKKALCEKCDLKDGDIFLDEVLNYLKNEKYHIAEIFNNGTIKVVSDKKTAYVFRNDNVHICIDEHFLNLNDESPFNGLEEKRMLILTDDNGDLFYHCHIAYFDNQGCLFVAAAEEVSDRDGNLIVDGRYVDYCGSSKGRFTTFEPTSLADKRDDLVANRIYLSALIDDVESAAEKNITKGAETIKDTPSFGNL